MGWGGVDAVSYNAERIRLGLVETDVLAEALSLFALKVQRGRVDLTADSCWGPRTDAAYRASRRIGDTTPFPRGHAAIIERFSDGLVVVDDPGQPGWLKEDRVWIRKNIRSKNWRGHHLHLHRDLVDRFIAALEAAHVASGFMPTRIGSLAQRRINGRADSALSTHAVGAAIDIDSADNRRGWALSRTSLGQNIRFPQVMEEHGFCWGGRWRGADIDAMHFQAGSPA